MLSFPSRNSHKSQFLDRSSFWSLKAFCSFECDKWVIDHLGHQITNSTGGFCFHGTCVKAVTIGNSVKGFRVTECVYSTRKYFLKFEFLLSTATCSFPKELLFSWYKWATFNISVISNCCSEWTCYVWEYYYSWHITTSMGTACSKPLSNREEVRAVNWITIQSEFQGPGCKEKRTGKKVNTQT